MAAPPTDLLKGKPKGIVFMPEATRAFNNLKELFITAAVLKLPNTTKSL